MTHVFIDEVHERDALVDFLLVIIRDRLLPARPDLKVVLMSATTDTALFVNYFAKGKKANIPRGGVGGVRGAIATTAATVDTAMVVPATPVSGRVSETPAMHISGRTFPVACYRLESIRSLVEQKDDLGIHTHLAHGTGAANLEVPGGEASETSAYMDPDAGDTAGAGGASRGAGKDGGGGGDTDDSSGESSDDDDDEKT